LTARGFQVHLVLVWHMHQPWYVDPVGTELQLPWVRLHGVSAYSDMAALHGEFPEIRASVSLSPSLLDQLLLYQQGSRDTYEELTLVPAEDLTPEQRGFLLRQFFSVHWERVLPRMPAYQQLLEKRGLEPPLETDGFTAGELRDLQVLFNLAWFGFSARGDVEIERLIEQGAGYSEEDKRLVLEKQRQLLEGVIPAWKRLCTDGSVESCCTAYYHGILPLLVDTNTARRASPEAWLPERFSHAGDARLQVTRALDRVEEVCGARARGLWPPEGAVSPEVVRLAVDCGLDYLVADSELLFHSLDESGSTPGRSRLYQPYRVGDCALFFRDNELSELVATEYARWDDSPRAAADLVERVEQRGEAARVDGDAPPVVVIAVDGENPWEAYPDRGRAFLASLYGRLAASERIRTVTLGEHLRAHPPITGLDYLHSGSRIEGNFAIWIGDPEKNRAWNLLGRARSRLERGQFDVSADDLALQEAQEHLLRAESSDWFWWLGEPFSSAEDPIYDTLFRGHITAMYRALGDSPPADLSRPIDQGGIVKAVRQPSAFIHPQINGKRTSFFEWRSGGFYRVPAGGSVYQEHSIITGLYWGFDVGRLFLRIDPVESQREGTALRLDTLSIWFELSASDRLITGRVALTEPPRLMLAVRRMGAQPEDLGLVEEIAYKDVIELAIPLARLGLAAGTRLGLSAHFARGDEVLSRVPRGGVIEVEVPGDDFGD
jgi:alpha-amylase/alpha-mannosidase (GH57 family)